MESCRQKNIIPSTNYKLKQLSKCLSKICRHAPDKPNNPVWRLRTFDDHDGWINLHELVHEFPWSDGARHDGCYPRHDDAAIIAETFYGRTVDHMAAIMMATVHVHEADGEEKQRLQFKVLMRDSGTAELFTRASQGHSWTLKAPWS
eukprot:4916921-Pyramimonas_sp.AAC.1